MINKTICYILSPPTPFPLRKHPYYSKPLLLLPFPVPLPLLFLASTSFTSLLFTYIEPTPNIFTLSFNEDMHTAAPNASEALNTGRDTLQDSLEARMTFEQIGLRYGPSADLRKLSRMAPSAVLQWYKDNKDLVSEALFGYEEPVKDPLRGRLVKFTAPYQHSAFSQATRILLLSTFILQYCELGVL